jgi:hypothetical protein
VEFYEKEHRADIEAAIIALISVFDNTWQYSLSFTYSEGALTVAGRLNVGIFTVTITATDAFGNHAGVVYTLTGKQLITKDALISAVEEAQAALAQATAGAADGNYPQAAINALSGAIASISPLIESETATQAQIDAAIELIQNAVNEFYSSVVAVDLTEAEAAIINAETIFDAAAVGGETGSYPLAAKQTLGNAITDAKSVVENQNSTQAQVDAAKTALENAVQTFLSAQIFVHTEALQEAVTSVESALSDAEVGVAEGQYPLAAAAALQEAVNEAKAILLNPLSTQTEIDTALASLGAALGIFEAAKNGVVPVPPGEDPVPVVVIVLSSLAGAIVLACGVMCFLLALKKKRASKL